MTSGFSTTPSISKLALITYFIVNVCDDDNYIDLLSLLYLVNRNDPLINERRFFIFYSEVPLVFPCSLGTGNRTLDIPEFLLSELDKFHGRVDSV